MRQIMVDVPRGQGDRVLAAAAACGGSSIERIRSTAADGRPTDTIVVRLENARLEPFMEALEPVPDVHISFIPTGVLALHPPRPGVVRQVTDVTARSPLEIFIAGLQSVGTWRGFLGYAVAAGVVVWLGLLTNRSFLLVGAMLIAPYGSPALNAAIASARGDWELLWRSVVRYAAGLAATIATAALLSLVYGLETMTDTMDSVADISSVAVLLPLAAGAAGALHLSNAEQNSLVSGAATGLLISASLAPPAGLVGMVAAMGEWDPIRSAAFLLMLQLAGINLAGMVVFRLFGLRTRGPRYRRGKRWVAAAAFGVTLAVLAGLLAWQFTAPPTALRRAAIEQDALDAAARAARAAPGVLLVDVSARIPRWRRSGPPVLHVTVYVAPARPGSSADALSRRVEAAVRRELSDLRAGVVPLVDVRVLRPR